MPQRFPHYVHASSTDRAYRIGQERSVKVFRLVSRGTIEELKYLRQVYKTQLQSETIVDVNDSDRKKSTRLFRGVAGDVSRKGELFGLENLLKFKDGTFMNYATKLTESQKFGVGIHDTSNLLDTVKNLSLDDLDDLGQDDNIFGDLARCKERGKNEQKSQPVLSTSTCSQFLLDRTCVVAPGNGADRDSDLEDEDDLGGMSQAVMAICEQVEVREANRGLLVEMPDIDVATVLQVRCHGDNGIRTTDSAQKGNAVVAAVPGSANSGLLPASSSNPDETQSPMNVAVSSTQHFKKVDQSGEVHERGPDMPSDGKATSVDCTIQANVVVEGEPIPSASGKKTSPRNTKVVGRTTDQIRRGEAGPTAFKASDLFFPGIKKRKKCSK